MEAKPQTLGSVILGCLVSSFPGPQASVTTSAGCSPFFLPSSLHLSLPPLLLRPLPQAPVSPTPSVPWGTLRAGL